jgi:alpha-methylacyl-CoA racemase
MRVIELAGIGPGPFAGMLLADMGADVIIVERPTTESQPTDRRTNISNRSRRSICIDLKQPDGIATLFALIEHADGLIEGFRPGVTERLGVGPDDCARVNPRLVYGRMTGWGQEGPLAKTAGHDIDYIALTGALDAIRRVGDRPMPPLNLLGDFGGGGMLLAFGVVCGVLEARQSGRGQVIDAAMIDGVAALSTMFWAQRASGTYNDQPGTNLLDTGAHFYEVYECSDGKFLALGAVEPQFYDELCRLVGFEQESDDVAHQYAFETWPKRKDDMAKLIATKPRDEWASILDGSDACAAPVLSFAEAPHHGHNAARGTFIERDGITQPAPAPRFSRTPGAIQCPPPCLGADTDSVLRDWASMSDAQVDLLRKSGAVA